MKIYDFRLPIVACLAAFQAFGFEATLSLQPPLISLGESATLRIEVRDAKNPQPPVLPNVPGLRFASAGQSTQHSWVNGKSDSFTAYTFQVYPQKTGTFQIGPFGYTVDGKTQPLQSSLKVVSTSGDAQQAQSWSEVLFARLEADRDSAYVQEPFGLILSIYSRQDVQMAGNINLQGMPQSGLDGFQWQESQPEREMVGNAMYNVRRFHTRTRALSTGTFDFNPVITVQVVAPNQRNSRQDPFFSSFFNQVETRPVDLAVKGVSLNIKPLPDAGKPASFSGAVGQFDFQVSAQPVAVHPGDPITLTINITGNGNFDRVMPPAFPNSDYFRLFGETVRKPEENAVRFEQVFSPRSADAIEIPSIEFSFFDTQTGRYRTITSSPIPINVTATSNRTAQVFAAKESIILPPPEEHAFATQSDVQRAVQWFSKVWKRIRLWLLIFPVALLIGLAISFGRKFHLHRRSNTVRVRRQKAPKAARKALRAAEHARKHGNAAAFHDALWDALSGYFGNRLNLPPGDVTPAIALRALGRLSFDPEQLNNLRAVFEQVESHRYGLPGAPSAEAMKQLQNSLEQVLKQCEKMRF